MTNRNQNNNIQSEELIHTYFDSSWFFSRGSGQNASFTTPDLFVDEAEKILQEREKKAENFFKEEVENESNCTNINTEETVESEPNQEESNCEAIVNKLETNSSEQTDDQAKKSEIEEKTSSF